MSAQEPRPKKIDMGSLGMVEVSAEGEVEGGTGAISQIMDAAAHERVERLSISPREAVMINLMDNLETLRDKLGRLYITLGTGNDRVIWTLQVKQVNEDVSHDKVLGYPWYRYTFTYLLISKLGFHTVSFKRAYKKDDVDGVLKDQTGAEISIINGIQVGPHATIIRILDDLLGKSPTEFSFPEYEPHFIQTDGGLSLVMPFREWDEMLPLTIKSKSNVGPTLSPATSAEAKEFLDFVNQKLVDSKKRDSEIIATVKEAGLWKMDLREFLKNLGELLRAFPQILPQLLRNISKKKSKRSS